MAHLLGDPANLAGTGTSLEESEQEIAEGRVRGLQHSGLLLGREDSRAAGTDALLDHPERITGDQLAFVCPAKATLQDRQGVGSARLIPARMSVNPSVGVIPLELVDGLAAMQGGEGVQEVGVEPEGLRGHLLPVLQLLDGLKVLLTDFVGLQHVAAAKPVQLLLDGIKLFLGLLLIGRTCLHELGPLALHGGIPPAIKLAKPRLCCASHRFTPLALVECVHFILRAIKGNASHKHLFSG